MPTTAKIGTQIIGATNNKNRSSTDITANASTDELIPGALYIINDATGTITITANTAPVGTEFHFFVNTLNNGVDFAGGSAGILAPDNLTVVSKQYTHITLKYNASNRAFLIPSATLA